MSLTLRSTEPRDLAGLVDLRERITGQPVPERNAAFYQWKLFDGPHRSRAFVVEAEGRIVASLSLNIYDAWLRGERVLVGEFGDGFTDSDYRRRGIFKSLMEAIIEVSGDLALLYGRPNDRSFPGLVKYGGLHEHFKLSIGRKVSTLNDVLAWLRLPTAEPRPQVSCPFIPVENWPEQIAQQVDQRLRQDYAFALCRDLPTLDWRYGQRANPFHHFALPRGDASGLFDAVLTFKALPSGDWALVDIGSLRMPSAQELRALWRYLAQLPQGPQRIFTWINPQEASMKRELQGGGFVFSKPQLHFIARGAVPPASEWYFQAGDTDAF